MHRHGWLRALALLAAIAILLFAAWGVLFIMLVGGMSAQAPDPFIASGDPCCGHPDTWGEVAWGVAWTLACIVIDALLVCVAVSLIVWAARGRWPRLKRLALLPGGALIAAALVLTAVLVPQFDEGRTPPDCDSFSFKRSAWRSLDVDTQLDTAYGVAHCNAIDGKTPVQVRRLLGRPQTQDEMGGQTYWQYSGLAVFFDDGRVARTSVGE